MYLRIRPLGNVPAVGEKWTISPAYRWVPLAATLTQPMLQSLANRLVTTINLAALGQLANALSNGANISGWRVEQYSEDDKLNAVAEANYAAPLASATAATKSLQDAVVCSLRTSTPGARGRGRVYWPAYGITLTNWRISTPTPVQLAAAFKSLFLAIQGEINAEAGANLISNVAELAVRSSTRRESYKVESLQVGDVLDSQRRRRDKVTEGRTLIAY
uniref:Uncharacterized protein n=1 Tax=uncultured prokaryote TaxID=198431 RepID=A0A0H5PYN7_9ZZZZ|nr:hypothetical protein [uncultured prokaryote]CRY95172.1 hypothetical protein [uncultured prokaryote]